METQHIKLSINEEDGLINIFNKAENEWIIKNAGVSFKIVPYLELKEVHKDSFEVDVPEWNSRNNDCEYEVEKTNQSISLFCEAGNKGKLQVMFTPDTKAGFVTIDFSFKNISEQPLRLRRLEILNSFDVFPDKDQEKLRLLDGTSGGGNNKVRKLSDFTAENNMLFFIADTGDPRSLVVGGYTYKEYRKLIKSDSSGFSVFVWDPVGKRIDQGQKYTSPDRFYLDATANNPFEAMELYADRFKKSQQIEPHYYTFPSVCMWFTSVNLFGDDKGTKNNTVGAVQEMDNIVNSGYLKYTPVAVRLVPDCYEQNNQQGWWDDEHWQKYGRKERCIVERHYEKPFETTNKWTSAISERGGIPFTYMQPGVRSEDYAETFPGHMLYNRAHKYIMEDGNHVVHHHGIMGPMYGKKLQTSYDYTDEGFKKHVENVYKNLNKNGVQGIFFDYPNYAFPYLGGMDDRYSTAASAYRKLYEITRKNMGEDAYIQERLGPRSDITLDMVSSVRTAGDNNSLTLPEMRKVALRWYKNRKLVNYDMDGKGLLRHGHEKEIITPKERKALLTMSYTITGRLLLTESFRLFSPEVIHDISRVFPFHATELSARPLDAFIREFPSVFDFSISADWHQLVLYHSNNEEKPRQFVIPVSGNTAFGAIGLPHNADYYLYDFWNDKFEGKVSGDEKIKQTVTTGEARVLSIHKVVNHPQWISTNRHLMQGYVDLVKKPEWNEKEKSLKATSSVIGDETYIVTLALNGYTPKDVHSDNGKITLSKRENEPDLIDLLIETNSNTIVNWKITFSR